MNETQSIKFFVSDSFSIEIEGIFGFSFFSEKTYYLLL